MASCARIAQQLQALLDAELSHAERLICEEHLNQCAECRGKLQQHRAVAAELFEALAPQHLQEDLTPKVMAHLPEMETTLAAVKDTNWRVKHPYPASHLLSRLLPAFAPVLILLLSVALYMAWPASPLPADSIGMVTERLGAVMRFEGGGLAGRGVARESVIAKNDRLESAGGAGLVVSLMGETTVKMGEDSRIQVEGARRLALEKGRIWLNVGKDGSNFRVRTPGASVTVFGTTFGVSVDETATVVTVLEGEVQVEQTGGGDNAFAVLYANDQVIVRPGQALEKRRITSAASELSWADQLQPEPAALALYEERLGYRAPLITSAVQVFVAPTRGRDVQTIEFSWQPEGGGASRVAYHVYFFDDGLRPLFKEFIAPEILVREDGGTFAIPVPESVDMRSVNVLHIRVVPDHSTGSTPTVFKSINAVGAAS